MWVRRSKAKANNLPPDRDAFPRTSGLPTQSPLFWVEQKDRYLRQLLIRDIEEATGRRLLVYFGDRSKQGSGIEPRDVAHMSELLGDVGGHPTDLLLETTGGITDAAEAVISLLRNALPDFRVVVANAAKSNGTLMAIAANAIVMGITSELGPIEPSLGEIPCSILEMAQVAATNFPLHMLGKFALKQSRGLATQLLKSGMLSGKNEAEISAVVDALSTRDRFPSHGSVVDYKEARVLGLRVDYLPPEDLIWQRIWLLYCMFDFDCRKGGYIKIFEGRAKSLALVSPPAIATK